MSIQNPLLQAMNQWEGLIARAQTDERFRERLLRDPEAALSEAGIQIRGDLPVRVLDATEAQYLILPPRTRQPAPQGPLTGTKPAKGVFEYRDGWISQEVEISEDNVKKLLELGTDVAKIAGLIGMLGGPELKMIAGVLAIYIAAEAAAIKFRDAGNGVILTAIKTYGLVAPADLVWVPSPR